MARTDVTDVVPKGGGRRRSWLPPWWRRSKMRPKVDFLSRMSHEIRTPMNAIIGMSTIAAQSIGDDEQVESVFPRLAFPPGSLLSLVNDIPGYEPD